MREPSAELARAEERARSGRLAEAEAMLRRILPRCAAHPRANALMTFVLAHQARFDQAEFFARRAATLEPANSGHIITLANILSNLNKRPEAATLLVKLVDAEPGNAEAWSTLSRVRFGQMHFAAALDAARRAEAIMPEDPRGASAIGSTLLQLGRATEALALLERAAQSPAATPNLLEVVAVAMNYLPGFDESRTLETHRRYARSLVQVLGPSPTRPPARPAAGRLRIGFLSPDLRAHAIISFFEPLLDHLDRSRFEVVCISTGPIHDAVSDRLKAKCDRWVADTRTDPIAITADLRSLQLDVLVDLIGLFDGHRQAVFHLRPAPVQLTWLGYPNTTGMGAMDARLVDSITDPPDPPLATDRWATEKLVRLDPCFLCYRGEESAPLTTTPPSQTAGRIAFGSFNTLQKLNDQVLELWACVLRAVPGSRLLIKALSLAEPEARGLLSERCLAAGLDPAALEFLSPTKTHSEHLAAYSRVDIALDSFPYHGTTTTCEALWMGVPVVTLAGTVHRARVGASLLAAAGLPELVASTPEEFVQIATSLAASPHRLAELRTTLRERLRAGPLGDGPAFAARFGAAVAELCGRPDRSGNLP